MNSPGGHERAGDHGPVVCIGASWGGLDALRVILRRLPAGLSTPIFVVQHRGEDDPIIKYPQTLGRVTPLVVCEPEDKQPIERGHVYLAPAGYHMLVNDSHIALSVEDRVRWARPSVDVLFESAAAARGPNVIAVVLTGANDDGARGAKAVHAAGGCVIVQDPETAERHEMPRAAVATGIADAVLQLEEIPAELTRRLGAE